MNFDNMMAALEMMGQGMLGIFVVLGMIALLVCLMQKIDNRKSEYGAHSACAVRICKGKRAGPFGSGALPLPLL